MKRGAFTRCKFAILTFVALLVAIGSPQSANAAGAPGGGQLLYFGGPVKVSPRIYIDYWGSEWANGFSSGGYTSNQAEKYINDFFSQIGGSPWADILTQYCMGIPAPMNALPTSCSARGTHITNAPNQLASFTIHGAQLPQHLTQSDVTNEAVWAVNAFGGFNPHAVYFILTPRGYYAPDGPQDTSDCAWHDVAYTKTWHGIILPGAKPIPYAYLPYQPDFPRSTLGCNQHLVNPAWNTYGNGYFDDYSIKAGHEYAELLTDPYGPTAAQYGWKDATGHEIGDKCEGTGPFADITLGAHLYAVQALWSNVDNGCVMGFPTPTLKEYPLPTPSLPIAMTAGPDGNLWFTDAYAHAIRRMTRAGQVSTFPLWYSDSVATAITRGPDGNLWFTDEGHNAIGKITLAGHVTEYLAPGGPNNQPVDLTSGPGGALWFVYALGGRTIGKITTDGHFTIFPLPSGYAGAADTITTGSDGNLWFPDTTDGAGYARRIGRMTPTGSVTEYTLPAALGSGIQMSGLTPGSDGALWFTSPNWIIRMTTKARFSLYPLPPGVAAGDFARGPDKSQWFFAGSSSTSLDIGRITSAGQASLVPFHPTYSNITGALTNGPDGSLWFIEQALSPTGTSAIGRLTP